MDDDELIRQLREMAESFQQELAPVATPEQIDESEHLLGYPLPPFLCRVYTEIGNGGIGPRADWRGRRGHRWLRWRC